MWKKQENKKNNRKFRKERKYVKNEKKIEEVRNQICNLLIRPINAAQPHILSNLRNVFSKGKEARDYHAGCTGPASCCSYSQSFKKLKRAGPAQYIPAACVAITGRSRNVTRPLTPCHLPVHTTSSATHVFSRPKCHHQPTTAVTLSALIIL